MKNIQTTTVSVNGQSVTYYDSGEGSPSGETVFLLHGTGGSAENNFWALFPMLAMRHRVVALDFVDPDLDEPGAEHYVQQVLQVMQSLRLPGLPHLVGYSFGAVIGAAFAARHGSLLNSLTLVAGWVKTDVQQQLRNDIWRTLYAENSKAHVAFSVFTNFSQNFVNAKNPAELESLIKAVIAGPDRSKKMTFNRTVDLTNDLPRIDIPCFVVGCTQDQTTPIRHSRMLFGGIKDCRYAEINSGHGVIHERTSELFTMIDMFVRDVDSMPAGYIVKNSHA
jgi:pimeloyl-ACP methyl ester carboxylesterase